MPISNDVIQAIRFANRKHKAKNQRRKWSKKPYITHPIAVIRLLIEHTEPTDTMLMAAALHDTVEDTDATIPEIANTFGLDVGVLVWYLTDFAEPMDGNRAKRMQINRDHIQRAPAEAQTIKAADCAHNLIDCVETAGGFALRYIPEKRAMFEVLDKADVNIMRVFEQILTEQEKKLRETYRMS